MNTASRIVFSMVQSVAYHELTYYTLAHPDSLYFIHQHIVDAQMAQTASAQTKAIGMVYALVGLYLSVEKNYTGRQVQQAHLQLAQNKKDLPAIILPVERGEITVEDVLRSAPGDERDEMIRAWCASVWEAYRDQRATIIKYCQLNLNA